MDRERAAADRGAGDPFRGEDETMRDRHRRLTRIGDGVENVVPETR
jgi:hypothetical protein